MDKRNIATAVHFLTLLIWLMSSPLYAWTPEGSEPRPAKSQGSSSQEPHLKEAIDVQKFGDNSLEPSPSDSAPSPVKVMVFGDSIAAGYGVDPAEAFPAQLQAIAEREGYFVRIINAGLSGETSAGGARRITWVLKQQVDILLIELGGNDALRGLPLAQLEMNLRNIVTTARSLHPKIRIILAGMRAPPNLGEPFASEFASVYPRLAAELSLNLVPFILEGVGGVEGMNQADGIHPTPEGHKRIAEHVWPYLMKEVAQFPFAVSRSQSKSTHSIN